MPPILSQIVQIAMSLRDTTTDEMANFRESQEERLCVKWYESAYKGYGAKVRYIHELSQTTHSLRYQVQLKRYPEFEMG